MLWMCPYCGHALPHVLSDGTGTCINCRRVFDSSPMNRLLSGGWLVRKQHITQPIVLEQHGFSKKNAKLLIKFVSENCLSHEEWVKTLKELGISSDYMPVEDQ